ncbi:23170_t:CDS:1 [Dentiscutata erythropus]|uniref:23170_t:CDS:1 n=1 Tax=Dentiscutata erythropus TaxID=1348616 RepID=A0A9N9D7J1_9GLOM|nr:23170_t:CDS:1 [Dentiscutata erythropus]
MKNFRYFNVFITIFALIFITGPVKSCEKKCREGISDAFADSWGPEIAPIFDDLRTTVTTSLFFDMNLDDISDEWKVIDIVTRELATEVYNQINDFKNTYLRNMSTVIQDSIFNVLPQFKGNCNDPFRVKQPPLGVNWTSQDCERMDYICGNPPSICHFIGIAKQKCFNSLIQRIIDNSDTNGIYIQAIQHKVKTIADKHSLAYDGTKSITKSITKVVQNSLYEFPSYFKSRFCPDNCLQYDEDIKLLLLSYP